MPKKYRPSPLGHNVITAHKDTAKLTITKSKKTYVSTKFSSAKKVYDRNQYIEKVFVKSEDIQNQQWLLNLAEEFLRDMKEDSNEALSGLTRLEQALKDLEHDLSEQQNSEEDSSKLEALELALQSLGDDSSEQTMSGQESATDNINTTDN